MKKYKVGGRKKIIKTGINISFFLTKIVKQTMTLLYSIILTMFADRFINWY